MWAIGLLHSYLTLREIDMLEVLPVLLVAATPAFFTYMYLAHGRPPLFAAAAVFNAIVALAMVSL